MLNREVYINSLREYKDNNKIKLISGMRQSGKTTIVKKFVKELEIDDFINIMVGDLQRIDIYGNNGFQIKQDIPPLVWDAFRILVKEGYDKQLIKSSK